MKSKSNCIVIPVYKSFENISETEKLSLRQCFKVLGKHPTYFVGPDDFDFTEFINEARLFGVNALSIKFDKKYFKDIDGYNKLMISKSFYKQFRRYKYLLIYQTDAFVFRDELDYWSSLGYDYIGAPWFEGWDLATADSEFIGVGNGGFSLRNVSSHIKVLNTLSYIKPFLEVWDEFIKDISKQSFFVMLNNITLKNNTFHRFNDFELNEDTFWGDVVNKKFAWFKVPDKNTALKFSMEVNAPSLYNINNRQLPFGCHAWERYHYDFWKVFVDRSSKAE